MTTANIIFVNNGKQNISHESSKKQKLSFFLVEILADMVPIAMVLLNK